MESEGLREGRFCFENMSRIYNWGNGWVYLNKRGKF